MKHYRITSLVVLCLTFLFLSCKDQGIVGPPRSVEMRPLTTAELKLVQANGDFWLDLLKSIEEVDQKENVFISPLSISMALGMTLNGAQGSTLDSMKNVLKFNTMSIEEINESYKSLIALLANVDPNVQFNIANSIWYRNDFKVEQDFIDVNKLFFDAMVSPLNFADPAAKDIINGWVNEKTNGKIPTILDKPVPSAMVMYLINALYFKGVWTSKFDKDLTRDDLFTLRDSSKVACMMMIQKGTFRYMVGNDYQAIELPYGGQAFSMVVILPAADTEIHSFIESFSIQRWTTLIGGFDSNELTLMLPKFKLEYSVSLIGPLVALGMEIAFNPSRADFTRINKAGELFIAEARHKTYVEVNEEGTEAAAVTSIGIGTTSEGNMMRINRPFLFLIRERNSGAILFVGKILNPNG